VFVLNSCGCQAAGGSSQGDIEENVRTAAHVILQHVTIFLYGIYTLFQRLMPRITFEA
jgi:hypothetical protein